MITTVPVRLHIAAGTCLLALLGAGCVPNAEQRPTGSVPPDVQSEMQRRMGGTTGPAGASNPSGSNSGMAPGAPQMRPGSR